MSDPKDGDFKKKLMRALLQGEIFYNFRKTLPDNVVLYRFDDFESQLKSNLVSLDGDYVVFEKQVSWQKQSIYFSNQAILEDFRVRLLSAGIEVVDDPDDQQTLLMIE